MLVLPGVYDHRSPNGNTIVALIGSDSARITAAMVRNIKGTPRTGREAGNSSWDFLCSVIERRRAVVDTRVTFQMTSYSHDYMGCVQVDFDAMPAGWVSAVGAAGGDDSAHSVTSPFWFRPPRPFDLGIAPFSLLQ